MIANFIYLYRDAGNHKLWGEILLTNRKNLDVRCAAQTIRSVLIDGEFFVAEDLGIPVLRFEQRDSDLDHGWHEFHSLEAAPAHRSSPPRDLADFLRELHVASHKWKRIC